MARYTSTARVPIHIRFLVRRNWSIDARMETLMEQRRVNAGVPHSARAILSDSGAAGLVRIVHNVHCTLFNMILIQYIFGLVAGPGVYTAINVFAGARTGSRSC